jgi:hypothetical protein
MTRRDADPLASGETAGACSGAAQVAVADRRIEAWFRPFVGVVQTGHLRGPGPLDG